MIYASHVIIHPINTNASVVKYVGFIYRYHMCIELSYIHTYTHTQSYTQKIEKNVNISDFV